MSSQDHKAGAPRPRRRDDDPTRPFRREIESESRPKPDSTLDLDEGEIEIIAGDEVNRGDPTRPTRTGTKPPPPPDRPDE